MKNKLFLSITMTVILLAGCTNNSIKTNSVKTYPSITLPYEITNQEVSEAKNEGYSVYTEYQELKEVKTRELTEEENQEFIEKMKNNASNNLNNDYKAVEFSFGNMTMIYNNKSFEYFDKNSAFIYDDQIVKSKFDKIIRYDRQEKLYTTEDLEKRIVYGVDYDNYKIIVLIEKEHLKNGLQFKTKIADEIIYIDIK